MALHYITTFARLTQSQAISQAILIAFSSLSDQWERRKSFTFFHLSKLFFIQICCFLYHGDQKINWWRICRWRAVNFEIHLCSSGVISDCIWRDLTASSMSKFSASVNSDLGSREWFLLARNPRRWACRSMIRCSRKCTRVWSYPLTSDLRDVYFFICLQWSCLKAVSVPTFVSNRRPAGLDRDERFLFGRISEKPKTADEFISFREHHRRVYIFFLKHEEDTLVYKTVLRIFELLFHFQNMALNISYCKLSIFFFFFFFWKKSQWIMERRPNFKNTQHSFRNKVLMSNCATFGRFPAFRSWDQFSRRNV